DDIAFGEMIYTGPIDAFFEYRYGHLPYRCLEFKHETLDKPQFQPVAVVNYPNDHLYTRITEFKHLTGQEHPKTSIVYEFSQAEGDPYYPIPRAENAAIYKKYQTLAQATPGVHFVGRLATYRYYNKDQVVAQALTLFSHLCGLNRTVATKLKHEPASGRITFPPLLITENSDRPEKNGHASHAKGTLELNPA